MNRERMTELENHYLATATGWKNSAKKHQWMWKLIGKSLMSNMILTQPRSSLSQNIYSLQRGKRVNPQPRNLADNTLISDQSEHHKSGPSRIMSYLIECEYEEYSVTSWYWWPEKRNKETESNYEEHSAQLVCNLQNWKRHENQGKTEEWWQLNDLQNLGLDPFVIEDITGTTSDI